MERAGGGGGSSGADGRLSSLLTAGRLLLKRGDVQAEDRGDLRGEASLDRAEGSMAAA